MLFQAIIYFPGTLLPRLSALTIMLIAAHAFSMKFVGVYALIVLVGEVSEATLSDWLRITFMRVRGLLTSQSRHEVMDVASLAIATAICSCILGLLLVQILSDEDKMSFSISVMLYIVGVAGNRFSSMVFQMSERKITFSVLESCRAASNLAAAISSMYLYPSPYCLIISLSVINIVFFVLATFYYPSEGGGHRSERLEKGSFLASAPALILLAVLNFSITSSDRFFLGLWTSHDEVALYAAAYTIARQGFDVIATAINAGGFVRLVAAYEHNSAAFVREFRKHSSLTGSLLMAAYCGLIWLRKDLSAVLLPLDYQNASSALIPIIAAGSVFLNIKNTCTDNILLLERKNLSQSLGLCIGAITTSILCFFLVPSLSVYGAAIAFAVGAMACLVISWIISRQFVKLGFSIRVLCAVFLPSATVSLEFAIMMPFLETFSHLSRLFLLASIGGLTALFSISVFFGCKKISGGSIS